MLLEIVIPDALPWIIGVALLIAIIIIISSFSELRKKNADFELKMARKDLDFQKVEMDLRNNVNTLALSQFEKFKAIELEGYKKLADQAGQEAALVALQRWKIENEDRIRKDAANRSV